MFFLTYLGRELRQRMRQSVVIALGLALGIGLVITVAAASAGVKKAQADVLSSLYGVGTNVTVTKKPHPSGSKHRITVGPPGLGGGSSGGGAQICNNGNCHTLNGGKIDNLTSMAYTPISQASVSSVARLHDVAAAAGGLILTDAQATIPSQAHPNAAAPSSFTVDGVDLRHRGLGPLSNAKIHSGRSLKAGDADSDVAVVDSNYAIANKLKAGSTITIGKKSFTVVGIVK